MGKIYDMIIIGSGPAGLSAGLYAGRARLEVLMI
jgi:thioredoxin reductase (NADPH)